MLIFLKSCRRPAAGSRVAVPVEERRPGAVRARARHRDVVVVLEPELLLQRDARGPLRHQLVEIGTRSEVIADASHDEHLDVVVDAGLEQEVRVPPPGRDGRDVELVGTVEGDRGDACARILLVEDDLLRRWDIGFGHVRRSLPRGTGSSRAARVRSP